MIAVMIAVAVAAQCSTEDAWHDLQFESMNQPQFRTGIIDLEETVISNESMEDASYPK